MGNRNKYKTPEQLREMKSEWGEEKVKKVKELLNKFGENELQSVLSEGFGWEDTEIKSIATIYGDDTKEVIAIVFVEVGDTTYRKVMDYITIQYYGLSFNNVDTNYKSEAYKIRK